MRTLKSTIMNKFKLYFILLIASVSLFSCQKDDPIAIVPPKEYSVQEPIERTAIDDYLKSYYILSVDDDLSVTFAPLIKTGKITTSNNSSIVTGTGTSFTNELMVGDELFTTTNAITTSVGTVLEINNNTQITLTSNASLSTVVDVPIKCFVKKTTIFEQKTYPLESRPVFLHGIEYTIKYLVLREGNGTAPTNTDSVLASYSGSYLKQTTTDNVSTVSATSFEEVKNPSGFFSLLSVIRGWSEIFPKFKTGSYSANSNGTISYTDFGAGVMFIPSGLAYFNSPSGTIPLYSPLVFGFKLYEISRDDTDGDGVPNKSEDLNNDDYLYSFRNTILYPTFPEDGIRYADDTDKDGIPNYLDTDDDGDGYTTKFEISKGSDPLDKAKIPNNS